MKKILFGGLVMAFLPVVSFSQSAYEGSIEYDKKKNQALVIEYDYSVEAVENALEQKMSSLGNKGKTEKGLFNKDKGFIVYRGAQVTDISDQGMDYIFKVEQKGKKDNVKAVVYMIVLKDGIDAVNTFGSDDKDNARAFLSSLLPDIKAADLELQIKTQEDVVSKAEKKLKDLKDDQESMEKKIKNLQDDLKKNAEKQEAQAKEIDAQKKALEGLKGKRG